MENVLIQTSAAHGRFPPPSERGSSHLTAGPCSRVGAHKLAAKIGASRKILLGPRSVASLASFWVHFYKKLTAAARLAVWRF
jgi:hypothetical protein